MFLRYKRHDKDARKSLGSIDVQARIDVPRKPEGNTSH